MVKLLRMMKWKDCRVKWWWPEVLSRNLPVRGDGSHENLKDTHSNLITAYNRGLNLVAGKMRNATK
jgi:hypothetical protein